MVGIAGIGGLVEGVVNGLDELFTSDEERENIKASVLKSVKEHEARIIKEQASVIRAEAQGESWLQRNWRPLLMCLFGVIIANNYIVSPMFSTESLPIPPDMWDLLKLGVGGYIVGRSAEKGIQKWKEK